MIHMPCSIKPQRATNMRILVWRPGTASLQSVTGFATDSRFLLVQDFGLVGRARISQSFVAQKLDRTDVCHGQGDLYVLYVPSLLLSITCLTWGARMPPHTGHRIGPCACPLPLTTRRSAERHLKALSRCAEPLSCFAVVYRSISRPSEGVKKQLQLSRSLS